MNKVFLIGNITRNLELRYTSKNKSVIDTNIAVQRKYSNQDGKKETDFINIQVWGNQAENLNKYCCKGSKIAIEGEIRVDTYEKSDGSKGYNNYILVNTVEFLDNNKKEKILEKEKTNDEIIMNVSNNKDPFEEIGKQIELDMNEDLPF